MRQILIPLIVVCVFVAVLFVLGDTAFKIEKNKRACEEQIGEKPDRLVCVNDNINCCYKRTIYQNQKYVSNETCYGLIKVTT